jgi:DNA-binding transcriptional ArsR family regulator
MNATNTPAEGTLFVPPPESINRATDTLRLLSHPERLRVLCHLAVEGELSVGALLERVDLSASALSQHLAKMRALQMVETRKERQTVYYRVERQDIFTILQTLHSLYCD